MIWVSGPMLSSFFFILSIRIYFYNILHPIETISGNHCLCFGFITITTLGYGDITPLTNRASALALIEAVVGQMYLVVLVAWLVGMHVSQRSR